VNQDKMPSDASTEIELAEVGVVELPLRLASGEFNATVLAVTIVRLTSRAGVVGYGYAYAWNKASAQALKVLLLDMSRNLVGLSVHARADMEAMIRREYTNMLGSRGMAMHGLSALDIAMWDCACNGLDLPVQTLLGGDRGLVPAYVSGAGLRPEPAAAASAASALVSKYSLPALKMWVSSGNVAREVQRVAAVREIIGPDCKLLLDAVKRYTVRDAIKLAEAVRQYDIEWLEDPLEPALVWRGLASVSANSPVPIATGEDCYDVDDWKRLLDLEAADIVLVDLQRVGGVSGWRTVEGLCRAAGVGLSTHHFPHLGVRLIAASPRGVFVEYRPWWDEIFGTLNVSNGKLVVASSPGVCPTPILHVEYESANG
jgi:L-alanine-DL-glutamate epimerase-like enolase superfamily enzyme